MIIEQIRTITEPFHGNYPQDGGHPFSRDSVAWRCSGCNKIWLTEKLANKHVCDGDQNEIQISSSSTQA